jgi:hypothetical protein
MTDSWIWDGAAAPVEDELYQILCGVMAGRFDGFVVGIGQKWSLLAATLNGGYFDGYRAFRLKDVDRVRRGKSFGGRFARTQPEWPPLPPLVDLDSTVGVVTSMAACSALIGIEKARERQALWIGTLHKAGRKWVWLHEVDPAGSWRDQPLGYRTRQITNVEIGTHYLTALAEVADDQPTL